MDLIDRLKQIGERLEKVRDQVNTEEATKNAFIMPFIQALGYDVFNPIEVMPEYTADLGIKKGEKVDYCILKDDKPIILIECKSLGQKKLDVHKSQLHRYFHVTSARFGILTNGQTFQFYTDLDKNNIMDDRPFFELDLLDLTEAKINSLKNFHKSNFDADSIMDSATELKYTKEIRELLYKELHHPSDAFVKFILQQIYAKRATAKVVEQFVPLVTNSIKNMLSKMVNDRLNSAMQIEESKEIEKEEIEEVVSDIITTEEELQAYRIVQAILLQKISNDRIAFRDKKTYFGILLDDNNRKPICRLHFNRQVKCIELFDAEKNGTKYEIDTLADIYQYSEQLLATIDYYDD